MADIIFEPSLVVWSKFVTDVAKLNVLFVFVFFYCFGVSQICSEKYVVILENDIH